MKQRSRAAGQPVKARRARTVTPKRRKAPKAALGRGSAIANLQEQLDRRTRERDEALEHQTATSEVLQVIGSSMADAKPVFERIVDSIERLFACRQIAIFLTPGDGLLHMVAGRGIKMESLFAVYPLPIEQTAAPAVLGARQQVYYPDVLNGANVPQSLRRAAQVIGNFSDVLTPMLWERRGVGMIAVTREANTPYNSNELSLLRTFADQAVIAIENVRLFEAEQQRARELSESLEQQTATADVLKVISRSTFDLDAVLTTLTESARALCGAPSAVVWLRDGDVMRLRAESGCTPEFVDFLATHPVRAGRESFTGRVMLTGEVVHSPDVQADPDYNFGPAPKLGNFRAGLGVPLLREGRVEGVFTLSRPEPDAFSPRQIELIKAFADQAVIAIENARLLTELRQRTDELGRSVGELQALGEVSQAVNSTLDLETVLSTIVAKAVQISGTEAGAIYAFDNTQREFHLRATYGMDQELIDALANQRFGRDEPNIAQALAQLEPIQIADLREEAPNAINEITLRAGYRARLAAPLIRGEDVVGLLVVRRRTPGAFPQNIVDLIKTFAAQSAVAIENAHLFQNVEASLENLRTAQDRLARRRSSRRSVS